VRPIHGRGGTSGLRHEVALESLPPTLRIKYQAEHSAIDLHDTSPRALTITTPGGTHLWEKRFALIAPALDAIERGEKIDPLLREIAAQPGARSVRTLRNWINRYLAGGIGGLQRNGRADAGKKMVFISKAWTARALAGGLSDDACKTIVEAIELRLRSLYAHGVPGWKQVAELALPHLAELSREVGLNLSDAEALTICRLPRHFVRRWDRHALVAIRKNDAKRYADKYTPRMRLDRSSVLPMEWVAGDTHNVDIYYRRADGSLATPKLVIWVDLGTNRVFGTIYFLEKGEGLRQEHVILSFMAMVQAWGFPANLYLDNGGEYNWTDFVEDALKVAAFTGRHLEIQGRDRRRGGVTRARPYAPQGKVVETMIGVLELRYFSIIPGYIGGERMRKKTQNVGRDPAPFPGSQDELRQQIAAQVERYNLTSSRAPHLHGQSPRALYEQRIEAGWKRITIDPHALDAVFATDVSPKVRDGFIRVGGDDYYDDALLDFIGMPVHARLPKVGDPARVAVLDRDRRVLCFAERATRPMFGDVEGAREQARRAKLARASVRALAADTTSIDLVAATAKVIALHPPPLVAPSAGRVMLTDMVHDIADAGRALSPPQARRDAKRAKQDRQAVALEAYLRRTKES
jgi:hypothetical protein